MAIARDLAARGIPVFIARPALDERGEWDPSAGVGGYRLPKGWQQPLPDPAVLDDWRPGDALALVCGHGLDVVDVDPRHGGEQAEAEWMAAGTWPRPLGIAQTPSGGRHYLVNSLGIASKDAALAGVDVKAGLPDGSGRGFVFIAPTVRLSKSTGELVAYEWSTPPNLDELDDLDDSGDVLAAHIKASRTPQAPQQDDVAHAAYTAMSEAQRAAVDRWLAGALDGIQRDLAGAAAWSEGVTDDRGRGWQKLTADACLRLGQLARADWTPWSLADAARHAQDVVPVPMANAVGLATVWQAQSGRRDPAPFPAGLASPVASEAAPPAEQVVHQVPPAGDGRQRSGSGEAHSGQVRMAYRLASRYVDELLYVAGIGWHYFDGTRWVEDDRGHARRAVLDVLRAALTESIGDKQLRADVAKCESDSGIGGVLGIAAALVEFAATVDDLDADPHLLNCANGTLDLRSMTLRAHDPADRLTKVTTAAYQPDADQSVWDAFLAAVLPDEAERAYLQRVVGQALLGRVTEHLLPVLIGTGANGKSTFNGAVGEALGGYCAVIDPSLLMAHDRGRGSVGPELMQLLGARLVIGSETEDGRKLDEATMKRLTGGDRLTARRLYREPVEWDPTHQLLYVTNHLPTVRGNDPAVWRRIRVIPFGVVIPPEDRDPELPQRLALHADAIFSWAVAGYADYRAGGMREPDTVMRATEDYRAESDAVARFITDACMVSPASSATTREVFGAWQSWAIRDGAESLSERAFGKELDRLGYPANRTRKGATRGLMLYDVEDAKERGGDGR